MFSLHDKFQGSKYAIEERLSYMCSLPKMANKIHSGESRFTYIKRSIKFCVNGLRHEQELSSLKRVFTCPELAGVLTHFPSLLEKPFHPYVIVDWNLAKRRIAVENHFLLIKEIFGEDAYKIYQPGGYQLFEFVSKTDEIFSVELFPGYQNEGSMGIRLCEADGSELYSLTFHLDSDKYRSITIGALQGPNDRISERQNKISMLTKSIFGLRPKAMMLEVLYMLADSLAIDKIYGVSNQAHIYQSKYYSDVKRSQMSFDADSFWDEYSAVKISALLFEFPKSIIRKDIAAIKSSKRSQYRKRYSWLDEAALYVGEAMESLVVSRPKKHLPEEYSRAA